MSRALAHCRWCGTDLSQPSSDPHGRGRPPTFCSDDHRNLYRRTFGTSDYAGAVILEASCHCHGIDTTDLPGPVRAPGAYAEAYELTLTATHGHDVTVDVHPVEVVSAVGNVIGGMDTGHRREGAFA